MNPNSLAYFLLIYHGITDKEAEKIILTPEEQKEYLAQLTKVKKQSKFNMNRKARRIR